MNTTNEIPSKTLTNFVVKPITTNRLGSMDLVFINKMDSKKYRATEGIVETVPDYIVLDVLDALRMGLIGSNDSYKKAIRGPSEKLGIKPGDIIGFHYNEVDTLELKDDDYLFVQGRTLIYSRNDDGVKPQLGWVIISKIQLPEKTEGGIYYPTARYRTDRYKVDSVPLTAEDFAPGDEVYIEHYNKTGQPLVITTFIDGQEYLRVGQNRIFARHEE